MRFGLLGILCLAGAILFPLVSEAKSPAKAPAKVCVSRINVIEGCSACETMQNWLRAGGVKLETTSVDRGSYKLYPTVEYSDKTVDHGRRMYKQQVVIPEKICVISCSVGTE